MIAIIQLIAIFAVPIAIIRYHNFIITKWIGTIGTAYLLGIVVALLVYILNQLGIVFSLNTDVGEVGSHLAISIAIPLLLFSANLQETKKLSSVVLKSFGSLIASAVIVSSIVFYVYGAYIDYGGELSAMAIGLYTGGTPNLNALGNIFGLDGTIIGIANLSDMIIGAIFYMFLLILCKPLLAKILKKPGSDLYLTQESNVENTEIIDLHVFRDYKNLFKRFVLAFSIALFSAILGYLVFVIVGSPEGKMIDLLVPTMMISVTIFGIIASFNKKIRETKGMNILGQYFILVFSFALASSLDFSRMQGVFGTTIILYGVITIGVFILHVFFSKLLDIDTDCTMITLTAGLYGPAFVPAVTRQIKNDDLTIPGLITGSIGYAIGTFLGLLLGLLYLM